MKRKLYVPLICTALLFLFSLNSYSQTTEDWNKMSDYLSSLGLSRETSDDIKEVIESRHTSIIKTAVMSPEEPGDNEPVVITASIVSPPEMSGEETESVSINYSTNWGETWEKIDMEQDQDDDRIWTGEIPGQPSGTEIIWGLQASNYFDEITVEAVCDLENGVVPEENDEIPEACKDEKNPEICHATRPIGCMFPMAVSSDDFKMYQDATSDIPEDLNLRTSRVGFDDKRLYLDITVNGKVTPGQLSPTDIHIYVAGWLNPDRAGSELGFEAILKQGAAILYAPLNPTDKCAIYFLNAGALLETNRTSGTCEAIENHLILSIDRKIFEPNPSKTLEFTFMTLTQRQLSIPDVELEDNSIFTKVILADRYYSIP